MPVRAHHQKLTALVDCMVQYGRRQFANAEFGAREHVEDAEAARIGERLEELGESGRSGQETERKRVSPAE